MFFNVLSVLSDAKVAHTKDLLDFLYGGSLCLQVDSAMSMLALATTLQIDSAKDLCQQFLTECNSDNNLLVENKPSLIPVPNVYLKPSAEGHTATKQYSDIASQKKLPSDSTSLEEQNVHTEIGAHEIQCIKEHIQTRKGKDVTETKLKRCDAKSDYSNENKMENMDGNDERLPVSGFTASDVKQLQTVSHNSQKHGAIEQKNYPSHDTFQSYFSGYKHCPDNLAPLQPSSTESRSSQEITHKEEPPNVHLKLNKPADGSKEIADMPLNLCRRDINSYQQKAVVHFDMFQMRRENENHTVLDLSSKSTGMGTGIPILSAAGGHQTPVGYHGAEQMIPMDVVPSRPAATKMQSELPLRSLYGYQPVSEREACTLATNIRNISQNEFHGTVKEKKSQRGRYKKETTKLPMTTGANEVVDESFITTAPVCDAGYRYIDRKQNAALSTISKDPDHTKPSRDMDIKDICMLGIKCLSEKVAVPDFGCLLKNDSESSIATAAATSKVGKHKFMFENHEVYLSRLQDFVHFVTVE